MEKIDKHPNGHHEALHRLSDQFIAHANSPENVGPLKQANGTAKGVGTCGDSVEIFIIVNGREIKDIKHIPNGCAYTIACGSALTTLVRGRPLDEALKVTPEDVANALGGLPEDHRHCAALAVNTMGEAIDDYYQHLWCHRDENAKGGKRK
jgi:NifU-like protein involved in Fe-S cluster formation